MLQAHLEVDALMHEIDRRHFVVVDLAREDALEELASRLNGDGVIHERAASNGGAGHTMTLLAWIPSSTPVNTSSFVGGETDMLLDGCNGGNGAEPGHPSVRL